MGFLMDVRFMGRGVKTTKIGQFCTKLYAFWYKIKQKLKKKKKKWVPVGFFYRQAVFLEILKLKLKNPYKIASSSSNAITFLKKMWNSKIQS